MKMKIGKHLLRAVLGSALVANGTPLLAQTVTLSECDWQSSAQNLPEPWEAHTRSFANGNVRLALLDTIEPAVGWAWLMVLSPPEQDWGGRQCRLLGLESAGFAGMDFSSLTAEYDPAIGLMFSVNVQWYDFALGQARPASLWFSLNQSTGEINAQLQTD